MSCEQFRHSPCSLWCKFPRLRLQFIWKAWQMSHQSLHRIVNMPPEWATQKLWSPAGSRFAQHMPLHCQQTSLIYARTFFSFVHFQIQFFAYHIRDCTIAVSKLLQMMQSQFAAHHCIWYWKGTSTSANVYEWVRAHVLQTWQARFDLRLQHTPVLYSLMVLQYRCSEICWFEKIFVSKYTLPAWSELYLDTVGPLIIESSQAKKRVSTGVL